MCKKGIGSKNFFNLRTFFFESRYKWVEYSPEISIVSINKICLTGCYLHNKSSFLSRMLLSNFSLKDILYHSAALQIHEVIQSLQR